MSNTRHIVLFDTEVAFKNLLPLSATRPLSDFRIGILTIREKWERYCPDARISCCGMDFINAAFSNDTDFEDDVLFVAGNVVPSSDFILELNTLAPGDAVVSGEEIIACRVDFQDFLAGDFKRKIELSSDLMIVKFVFDLFLFNARAIEEDFRMLVAGRESQPLSDTNMVIGDRFDSDGSPRIFIEEGAEVDAAVLNVKDGPIYIGKDVSVMECASVRGPLALCENAKVKMGARIYGGTTIGPFCKVGGEVDNTVFFGYSNKAHDGYLGNAVIGEWCNIGAGTNASNLKNDYSKIRVWNYATHTFMRTDLQFCGLIMGDHSKAGINCMFNTATVVGVGCNIHGAGFPRVFVPSFSEGSPVAGFTEVPFNRFCTIAERVMTRRNKHFGEKEKAMYAHIHAVTAGNRARHGSVTIVNKDEGSGEKMVVSPN